ncbi:hypothetical protein AB3X52_01875 [Nocardioides sp. DS6]|uniref:LapA family protein n=1 Tax=Nocardioides eburneus TaxID=3231482 RepID=A0ABV3STT0_9ACTN
MLVLGLVLMAFAVVAFCAGVFAAGDHGDASLLGIHVGATAVFLVGFCAGLALLFGFSLTKWGGKRQFRQARERRRLQGLAQQLDRAEAERTDTHDEHDERER